jgi:hypothetical protein
MHKNIIGTPHRFWDEPLLVLLGISGFFIICPEYLVPAIPKSPHYPYIMV